MDFSTRLRVALTVGVLVWCAGCGVGGGGGPAPGTSSPARVGTDDALAKLIPAEVATDGELVIGTDASFAPDEFMDTDGQTIIGWEVELGQAIATCR